MYAQTLYTPPIKKYVNKKNSVCRTCLKYGSNNIYLKIYERGKYGAEEVKFSQMLSTIVPELVLSLTNNPEICLQCAEEVIRSYSFKKKCLQTENTIDLFMKSVRSTSKKLDLLEISQFSQSRFMIYNAQNILSEWEDDSSEDLTSAGGRFESTVTNHIPDDFKNWFYFRTFRTRLRVKAGVCPHKFLDGKPKSEEDDKLEVSKRKEIIDRLLADSQSEQTNNLSLFGNNDDCLSTHKFLDGRPKSKKNDELGVSKKKEIVDRLLADSQSKETNDLSLSGNDNGNDCTFSDPVPSPLDKPPHVNEKKVKSLTNSKAKSKSTGSLIPVNSRPENYKKNGFVVNPKCLCGDSPLFNTSYYVNVNLPIVSHTHLNYGGKRGRKKKLDMCQTSDDLQQSKRNFPNILARPSSKSKTDISTGKEKHVDRNKQDSPNKNENFEKRISTATSPIILGQLEAVKIAEISNGSSLLCTETGLFTNPKGHRITLDGELMNDKEIEAAKLNVPVEKPNSLTICEETGLFKNLSGEHFNANGKMIDPHDVEAEKRAATVRGHHLFRIGEVFSVNEREGHSLPNTGSGINDSNNETILINDDSGATRNDMNEIRKSLLRIRDLSSMTNQSIDSTKDGLVDDGSKAQMRSEHLLRIKDISTMKGQSNIEGKSKKQKSAISSIHRKVRIVRTITKDKETRKNTIETVNPPTIVPPTVENKNETVLKQLLEQPLLPSETISKVAPATQPTPDIDNNNQNADITRRDPSEKEVDVKKELPDMDRLQINYPPIIDEEDTSSASETMSQENIQELIDSLDAADSYVDVPEFVQINKFTFKDLEALKEKGLALLKDVSSPASLPPPPVLNPLVSELNLEKLLKSRPENRITTRQEMLERLIVNEIEKARPDEPNSNSNDSVEKTGDIQIAFTGKSLVKSVGGYKEDNSVQTPPIPPLSWSRKGIQKIPLGPSKTDRRQRKRKLKIVPVAEKLASCPRRNSKERLVCVLKTSNKKKEMKYPDREVCVLFTNYSDDGLYINDHDYLVTPYKRNRILMEENGENFCMCYICGSKHNIIDHVPHMNSHEPKCPLCNVNLGTGYMLNLHMKVHASTCEHCSELVAHSKVLEHAAKHLEVDDVKVNQIDTV